MTSRSCVGSDNVINGVAGYGYFAVSYPILSYPIHCTANAADAHSERRVRWGSGCVTCRSRLVERQGDQPL